MPCPRCGQTIWTLAAFSPSSGGWCKCAEADRKAARLEAQARQIADTSQAGPIPDMQTQLEQLLDAVWAAEKEWRFDDRLDLAMGVRRHA